MDLPKFRKREPLQTHVNSPTKLLALLVHRGTVSPQLAHAALASGEPVAFLVREGVCSEAQWREWERTEAGTRPQLTRYELGDLIGEGGVGRVFAATDKTDGRKVALKVLKPELADDAVQTERFVREARLLIDLQHRHVVDGLRVAKEGATIFFAMEQLPGRCLQDVLADDGRLDEEVALQVVVDVAGALAALHAQGLVHRDVKPGNLLLDMFGTVWLTDFGFAKLRGDSNPSITGSGLVVGTPEYMSPEQRGGFASPASDIYGLGMTLYDLMAESVHLAQANNLELKVPRELVRIADRARHRDVRHRY